MTFAAMTMSMPTVSMTVLVMCVCIMLGVIVVMVMVVMIVWYNLSWNRLSDGTRRGDVVVVVAVGILLPLDTLRFRLVESHCSRLRFRWRILNMEW